MVGYYHHLSDMNLRKLRERVKDREAWNAAVHGSQRVRHDLTTEQQHSRGKGTIRAQFSSLLPAPAVFPSHLREGKKDHNHNNVVSRCQTIMEIDWKLQPGPGAVGKRVHWGDSCEPYKVTG